MALQEAFFALDAHPRNDDERIDVIRFLEDFRIQKGFSALDEIRESDSTVLYKGFPSGGQYMVEPCPEVVEFMAEFENAFADYEYEAELRIDWAGGDDLSPYIVKWSNKETEIDGLFGKTESQSESGGLESGIEKMLELPEVERFCAWSGLTADHFYEHGDSNCGEPLISVPNDFPDRRSIEVARDELAWWLQDYVEDGDGLFELSLLDCLMVSFLALNNGEYEPDSKWSTRLRELSDEFGPFF